MRWRTPSSTDWVLDEVPGPSYDRFPPLISEALYCSSGNSGRVPDPEKGSDLVGAAGFEPATSCSQSRRAAKLRYAPMSSSAT